MKPTRKLALSLLYREGFLSIGCAPCPRAVRAGERSRAGRWSGRDKTERGLWLEKTIMTCQIMPDPRQAAYSPEGVGWGGIT